MYSLLNFTFSEDSASSIYNMLHNLSWIASLKIDLDLLHPHFLYLQYSTPDGDAVEKPLATPLSYISTDWEGRKVSHRRDRRWEGERSSGMKG
jgi:hypothetical protein